MITLSTINNYTLQQVFDQVAKHLLTQRVAAKREGEFCRYRVGELKCAVGCLISDDEYSEVVEDSSVKELAHKYNMNRELRNLLQLLQLIHDSDHPDTWEAELKRLAKDKGLVFNDYTINS